jgi:HTH-type transcriptional regulator/antitoxin HigA
MAKKMIRPLRSEADYDAALEEIERYFDYEPKPDTPEADRFDLLALVIEDYEKKLWPIEPPDTIDAIRYRMEIGGYTQAEPA